MPLFLHGADIVQVDSYILYKETAFGHPDVNDDDNNSHKRFVIQLINSLICHAIDENTIQLAR